MLLNVIAFAALLLTALVVGVLWGTWLSLSRSIETFSAELFLAIGQRMIKNLAVPMRLLMVGVLLANGFLTYLLFHHGHTAAEILSTGGFISLVGVVATTIIFNVPIDLQIKQWTLTTLPADWQTVRRRWERFHELRTALSIVGLCLVTAGIVSFL